MLLARLTGCPDVVFGTTVSGRPHQLAGVERTVGMFVNTVPVRLRLDAAEPLADLLVRLQDEQVALAPHQHLGLADIQRLVGVGDLFDTTTVFRSRVLGAGPAGPTPAGETPAGQTMAGSGLRLVGTCATR